VIGGALLGAITSLIVLRAVRCASHAPRSRAGFRVAR
jgi:hypothetical protein